LRERERHRHMRANPRSGKRPFLSGRFNRPNYFTKILFSNLSLRTTIVFAEINIDCKLR
jgi:hypothetical protein